jgi:hypothetical protein
MQKEDYRELWFERMRLEFISYYGARVPPTERDHAARIRINEILQQIPQEIQGHFVEEMKEAARKGIAEREAAKKRDDGK